MTHQAATQQTETQATFDVWDPAHRPDPHPLYHRMRAEAPIYRARAPETGLGMYFLTRYADVQRALRHPDLGRDLTRLPAELAAPWRQPDDDPLARFRRHVLNLDPPDHTRLRRLMTPAFGSRTIAALEPRIRQLTTELVDAAAAAGDGAVDLIDAVAMPLPVIVIAELLGVPIDDRARFRGWVEAILRRGDQDELRRCGMEFVGYVTEQIAQRRTDPGEDLLSRLIAAEEHRPPADAAQRCPRSSGRNLAERADRLSPVELLSSVLLLLVAGHETTVNLIGNGVLELLRHPDQLALLRANPELVGSAVEEIVRFNGPVGYSRHLFAFADVTFDGTVIPHGAVVAPTLLAANRDPAVFAQPDAFDITRDPNRHLGFGQGIHFCLGAPLARLEGRIVIDALVHRFPGLALAVDPAELEWTPDLSLRGLRRLPVTLDG